MAARTPGHAAPSSLFYRLDVMPRRFSLHLALSQLIALAMAIELRAEGAQTSDRQAAGVASPEVTPVSSTTLITLPTVGDEGSSDGALVPAPADAISNDRISELEARIHQLEFDLASIADSSQAPAASHEQGLGTPMITSWGREGFQAQSENKEFKIHVGGRVQLDGVALSAPDLALGGVGAQDAVDFRRARLRVDGTMYYTMQWAAEARSLRRTTPS